VIAHATDNIWCKQPTRRYARGSNRPDGTLRSNYAETLSPRNTSTLCSGSSSFDRGTAADLAAHPPAVRQRDTPAGQDGYERALGCPERRSYRWGSVATDRPRGRFTSKNAVRTQLADSENRLRLRPVHAWNGRRCSPSQKAATPAAVGRCGGLAAVSDSVRPSDGSPRQASPGERAMSSL